VATGRNLFWAPGSSCAGHPARICTNRVGYPNIHAAARLDCPTCEFSAQINTLNYNTGQWRTGALNSVARNKVTGWFDDDGVLTLIATPAGPQDNGRCQAAARPDSYYIAIGDRISGPGIRVPPETAGAFAEPA